jgi:hypothetical protein
MRIVRIAAAPTPIAIRVDACVNTPAILTGPTMTEQIELLSQSVIAALD